MVEFNCSGRYGWEDLLEIMRLLRAPGGCPWDMEQTHSSIRRDFLEEVYEVADAIDRDCPEDLCEELGDVLFQVVFHSQIEKERGNFTVEDVIDGVSRKMVYRHPHVFGTVQADTSEQVLVNWDALKRKEKHQQTTADAIEAVPHTMPALWRAEKIQKKAAKSGFDWADPMEALEKLEEEVHELRQAMETGGDPDAHHGLREELGDALLAAVKVAQMTGIDPEDALHRSCDKYQSRYRCMENAAEKPLKDYTLEELVEFWKAAKENS